MRRFTKVSSFIGLRLYYRAALVICALPSVGFAETYSAKFLRNENGRMVFQANGTELSASLEPKTHFWRGRQSVDSSRFRPGDEVTVTTRVNERGTFLREVADTESYRWLGFIRKGVMLGTLRGGDKEGIFVDFADGSRYHYRMTAKANIVLQGQKATASQLKQGMAVFIKGRVTSTLDTSIQTLSDTPLMTEPPKGDEPGTMVGLVTDWNLEKHIVTILSGESEQKILIEKTSQGEQTKIGRDSFIWLIVERSDSGLLRAIEFQLISVKNR